MTALMSQTRRSATRRRRNRGKMMGLSPSRRSPHLHHQLARLQAHQQRLALRNPLRSLLRSRLAMPMLRLALHLLPRQAPRRMHSFLCPPSRTQTWSLHLHLLQLRAQVHPHPHPHPHLRARKLAGSPRPKTSRRTTTREICLGLDCRRHLQRHTKAQQEASLLQETPPEKLVAKEEQQRRQQRLVLVLTMQRRLPPPASRRAWTQS
mmetsp:Transcript_40117/g.86004  ORF Transcript_40117/g.86004 Transcript_40117/m.86004 type:complete len:207 (-) Transcript_40117:1848-2468(-)